MFNQPSDVIVGPNGDIYVADGHGPQTNARIVKFSKDGKFIKEWGKHGSGDADLEGPHALAFDSRGRLFVGDRTNNRVQIFDQDGKLLASWKQFGRPSGIYIDRDDMMYVTDSESREDNKPGDYGYNPGVKRGIRVGSVKDGKVIAFIPDPKPSGGTEHFRGRRRRSAGQCLRRRGRPERHEEVRQEVASRSRGISGCADDGGDFVVRVAGFPQDVDSVLAEQRRRPARRAAGVADIFIGEPRVRIAAERRMLGLAPPWPAPEPADRRTPAS